jgi:hypothetical protein
MVCYDRSGQTGQQPFAVECTSIANLERVAQSLKMETIADKKEMQAAFEAQRRPACGQARISDPYGFI